MAINIVILAAGNGTRLFPLSRINTPKQFLKLIDNKSLLELCIERNKNISHNFIFLTNKEQYFPLLEELEKFDKELNNKLLIQDEISETTSAIAFAALSAKSEEDILVVTPTDHLIKEKVKYEEIIKQAIKLAEENFIVTIGINPTEPNVNYGYIEVDKCKNTICEVKSFKEKPDIKTAKEFLKKGNYYWNSGIFVFKVKTFLNELKKFDKKLFEQIISLYCERKKINENTIILNNVTILNDKSVDYEIMEKTDKLKMIKGNFEWVDIGNWEVLIKYLNKNEKIKSLEENRNINFYSKNNKLCITMGLNDIYVIDAEDVLLISKKDKLNNLKEMIKRLKKEEPEILKNNNIEYRPWGKFEILHEEKFFKIKKITVKPGKSLSLQLHYHRSEHWIVLKGTAGVEIEGKEFLLRENESTFIKIGDKHRLFNPGKIPLEIIEIQMGQYIEEDDIVRLKDSNSNLRFGEF